MLFPALSTESNFFKWSWVLDGPRQATTLRSSLCEVISTRHRFGISEHLYARKTHHIVRPFLLGNEKIYGPSSFATPHWSTRTSILIESTYPMCPINVLKPLFHFDWHSQNARNGLPPVIESPTLPFSYAEPALPDWKKPFKKWFAFLQPWKWQRVPLCK